MGTWNVDGTSRPGILYLQVEGSLSEDEMREMVAAHNAAVDAFAGAEYRVFVDIRKMRTLSPGCAAIFEQAKTYSNSHLNFQGSAVLVESALVALQHKRTSMSGGVIDSELISEDEAACWEHLKTIRRR